MRFKRSTTEKRSGVNWDTFFGNHIGSFKTTSGRNVSEITSLKYSVVWRSVALIADAVASLPPRAFTENAQGQLIPTDIPPWVRKPSMPSPNSSLMPDIRRYDWYHQVLVSLLLWGNAYALIIRRPSDQAITNLLLFDPRVVNCQWVLDSFGHPTGVRKYQVYGGEWLYADSILHIQGMTLPGHPRGMSVIGQARESVAFGLTLEEFGARYFGQGSMAKVVIKVPGKTLEPEQAAAIVKTYEHFHKGNGNWHRPAVLSGPAGSDIVNISIPPEDAQFLQTREFQALDVARWFGVPPHRVGIVSKQSSWGSGLAEENTALVQSTYRRYILALESALSAYCPGSEDSGVRIRLDDSALLRGTINEQVQTWTQAVRGQIMTPNEARAQLGWAPIPGEDHLVQYISPSSKMPTVQPGNQSPNAKQDSENEPAEDDPATQDVGGSPGTGKGKPRPKVTPAAQPTGGSGAQSK